MTDYQEFLAKKAITATPVGFTVSEEDINPQLFVWQNAIVRWALRRGRAAIFADCGLGKTPMQLEWARHTSEQTGMPVLILAPLAVAQQTRREGEKFGIPVTVCRKQSDVTVGINIANYEMLQHFDPAEFGGIVLDESSILKNFSGSTRQAITDFASTIHYRLACTATPAPNDLIELTNHAEFLSIMTGKEIIALFFTQDGNTTYKWRLKGHAKEDFWKWMASWSIAMRKPSDLGYDDGAFALPPLHVHQEVVVMERQDQASAGAQLYLFPVEALTLQDRRNARKVSLPDRVKRAANLINASDKPWIAWCNLNSESIALTKAIPGAVEITGSDTPEHKSNAMLDFADGKIRVLVSKPTICGLGMNWQHCAREAFIGLSDSYEQYYQAIRRVWRFGQLEDVHIYVITAEIEGAVVKNINRKEQQAKSMMDNIVRHMAGLSLDRSTRNEMTYREDVVTGENWTMYLGDSIKRTKELASDSIRASIFSPPFPGMYAYTNSTHDIGNTTHIDEFMEHFSYLVPELLRVVMPGGMVGVHLMQLTSMKSRDGFVGVKDYRGKTIELFQKAGWIYAGEVCIDKNPQVQATRNKERGLLFKTLATDSTLMRMALADYLIYFRKPGDNPTPVRAGISEKYNNPNGWISEQEWIEWAAPVWYRRVKQDSRSGLHICEVCEDTAAEDYPSTLQSSPGIFETDVLNVAQARDTDDERHLCPLQLSVIERFVKLYSAPGDTIYSPFAGVGSEGFRSLQLGRRFIGCELKESYWRSAIRNLRSVDQVQERPNFLHLVEA